jgi:Immunoglobulin-like domain of bacterial spore germination
MTDLREALKRSASVSDSMEPDHSRIDKRTTQLVRRRRVAYGALSVMAFAAVGFAAFQLTGDETGGESNVAGQPSASSTNAEGPSASDVVLRIDPREPVEGDEISLIFQNLSSETLYFGTQYNVERSTDAGWDSLTDELSWTLPLLTLEGKKQDRTPIELNPGETWTAGEYRITKEFSYDGSMKPENVFESQVTFTVAPAPAPIVVTEPAEGEVLISPFTVAGNASVYEGTVSIRLKDGNGTVIAETFTTADCGGPCRGPYSGTVEFEVDKPQPGTLEVYSVSAETGEPMHMVTIPVELSPAES